MSYRLVEGCRQCSKRNPPQLCMYYIYVGPNEIIMICIRPRFDFIFSVPDLFLNSISFNRAMARNSFALKQEQHDGMVAHP